MGMYEGHGYRTYVIPWEIYSYLLPVFGRCASGRTRMYPMVEERQDKYIFIGSQYDYKDMLDRTEIIREELNLNL